MASSINAPVHSQAKKRTHGVIGSSEISSQKNSYAHPSAEETHNKTKSAGESKTEHISNVTCKNSIKNPADTSDVLAKKNSPHGNAGKNHSFSTTKANGETNSFETKGTFNGSTTGKSSDINTSSNKEVKKVAKDVHTSSSLPLSSPKASESSLNVSIEAVKSTQEPMDISVAATSQDTTDQIDTTASHSVPKVGKVSESGKLANSLSELEDEEEPAKKTKGVSASNTVKENKKTPEKVLEYMDKTFDQRRKVVTKRMPTIPNLQKLYPDLFTGKQLLLEFQRITKIDIDQKIQEFCVRYALAVIELAKDKEEAAPVLARWKQAKQENDALSQYWDMVTALCLLPLHFGENLMEMVLEIGDNEEVESEGKIVPTLVARGNIFCTDEFFLIAENTIVQEFEEFTIAFASLYSSYWVFNMVYPKTIGNTYNYIQRCIVQQREPGAIPIACRNFTKTLQKWNKGNE